MKTVLQEIRLHWDLIDNFLCLGQFVGGKHRVQTGSQGTPARIHNSIFYNYITISSTICLDHPGKRSSLTYPMRKCLLVRPLKSLHNQIIGVMIYFLNVTAGTPLEGSYCIPVILLLCYFNVYKENPPLLISNNLLIGLQLRYIRAFDRQQLSS